MKNNHSKEKNIYDKRSTISFIVSIIFLILAALSHLSELYLPDYVYKKDLEDLEIERQKVYEEFMDTDEYKNARFEALENLRESTPNVEEQMDSFYYITSTQYSKEVLENSNNEEYTNKIAAIDEKEQRLIKSYLTDYNSKYATLEKRSSDIASWSMAGFIASLIASYTNECKADVIRALKSRNDDSNHSQER